MTDAGFIRSSLRLFLSVDIVGSTAFKQAPHRPEKDGERLRPAEPWFDPIVQFYREIERTFTARWQHYCNKIAPRYSWPQGPAPEFWKGAGDELIYTKVLTDHREALACLHTWMASINAYRQIFRSTYPSLDLKSAAWLAGFPVHNAEVFFRSSVSDAASVQDDDDSIYSNLSLLKQYYAGGNHSIVRDFIGPSMDTGFRLATLANPRKLVVSVDLALMLVHASRIQERDFEYPPILFHYDGRETLKGVFGGAPYPILWIDMGAHVELNIAEDKLSDKEAVDSDRVKAFCELFVKEHSTFMFRPYITNNPDPYFGEMPPRHKERLERLRQYWIEETQRRKSEKEAALYEPSPAERKAEIDLDTPIREILAAIKSVAEKIRGG